MSALDDLDAAANEWWGEGNGIAEAAAIIAQIRPLTARVRELEATVERVRRLADFRGVIHAADIECAIDGAS